MAIALIGMVIFTSQDANSDTHWVCHSGSAGACIAVYPGSGDSGRKCYLNGNFSVYDCDRDVGVGPITPVEPY